MNEQAYDRTGAVDYAHRWANSRNPNYYNYDKLGGDCTNFVSQCIFAGSGVMNNSQSNGWYYRNANEKSPSWTGVEYLYSFLTGNSGGPGPYAVETTAYGVSPGDITQLSFDGKSFTHSQIIVQSGKGGASTILIAAHSIDSDYRPLNTYEYEAVRYLHIVGVKKR